MSIPMIRLFDEKNNPYELKLIAGAAGLSREVSWVQVMEDSEYASFLLRDELLFTTGIGRSQQNDWLKQFVTALIDAGSAGVVINVGKYILPKDITPDIIALCEEHRFPLFTMPWHVRLADITQSFLYGLFLTKQKEYELIEACKTLLFADDGTEKAMQTFLLHGFERCGTYQVIAIGDDAKSDARLTAYKGHLNGWGYHYILFPVKTGYILVFPAARKVSGKGVCEALLQHFDNDGIVLGCGMAVNSLDDISRSYTQALQSLAWATCHHEKTAYFDTLGIYAIFFSQENELAMRALYEQALTPLLAYDAMHHRNLFATLQSYLRHDGGIRAVAEETFAHRNTVLYRMQKIKQLLHCDLQDSNDRFTYMLACHIHTYLALKKEWSSYYNKL